MKRGGLSISRRIGGRPTSQGPSTYRLNMQNACCDQKRYRGFPCSLGAPRRDGPAPLDVGREPLPIRPACLHLPRPPRAEPSTFQKSSLHRTVHDRRDEILVVEMRRGNLPRGCLWQKVQSFKARQHTAANHFRVRPARVCLAHGAGRRRRSPSGLAVFRDETRASARIPGSSFR